MKEIERMGKEEYLIDFDLCGHLLNALNRLNMAFPQNFAAQWLTPALLVFLVYNLLQLHCQSPQNIEILLTIAHYWTSIKLKIRKLQDSLSWKDKRQHIP